MHGVIVELITPSMALFFATCFVVLWKMSSLGQHVLAFAAAYLLSALGFLATVFLPTDSLIAFHTAQLAYSIAAACMVWGACKRAGQGAYLGVLATIYVVAAAMLGLDVAFNPEVGPRLVIVNTGYGIMLLVGVVSLLSAPQRGLADNLIIAVISLSALDFLVRPSMTLLVEGHILVTGYHDSTYYSLINLVLSVKAVATATVLFAACIADFLIRLQQSALQDDLTGLKSRAAFEEEARAMMKRGQEENRPVAMVIADIDLFKQVNDIWGHQAGDVAITNFADLFGGAVRGCDISARVGGEEFCLIAWNCQLDDAARLAERIRLAFAQMEHDGIGAGICLTASFGVAQMHSGERYESLFSRADAALYRAKEEGRNQVIKDGRSARANTSQSEATQSGARQAA